jgi:Fic family protein
VLEARASSEIENIVTTADRLFRFAQDDESERADAATKEALRYQSALMQGLRVLARKPVTTGMAVEICRRAHSQSLSRAIIKRRTEYYRLLNNVTRDEAWEPGVLYMLDAVHDTALWTTKKIKAMRELLRRATAHVREHAPSLYSSELVELVFEQPYSRIGSVVSAGISKRQTASVYLKELCDFGVLREVKAGREKLFIHPNLMKLLTAEDHEVPEYR